MANKFKTDDSVKTIKSRGKDPSNNNTGVVGFTFFAVANYQTSITSPNDWSFYAAVHTLSANTIDIYVNDLTEQLSVGTMFAPTLTGFVIGAEHEEGGVSAPALARISHVRVYDRILTPRHIREISEDVSGIVRPRLRVWGFPEAGESPDARAFIPRAMVY